MKQLVNLSSHIIIWITIRHTERVLPAHIKVPHCVRQTKQWLDFLVTIGDSSGCRCHGYRRPQDFLLVILLFIQPAAPVSISSWQCDKIPVAGVKRWLLEDTIFTHGKYYRTTRYMLSGDTNGMGMLPWRRARPHLMAYNGSCRIMSEWDIV